MQERKWTGTQWKLGYRTCLNFISLNPLKYLKKCVFNVAGERGMGWTGGTQEQPGLPVCRGGKGGAHPLGRALERQHKGDSLTATDSVVINGEPCLEYNHSYSHKGTKLSGFHSHYPDSLKMLLHLAGQNFQLQVAGVSFGMPLMSCNL